MSFRDEDGRTLAGRILCAHIEPFFILPGGRVTPYSSDAVADFNFLQPGDRVRITGCPPNPDVATRINTDFAVYCVENYTKFPLRCQQVPRRIARTDPDFLGL